jgi:hypothetical protein
MARGECLSLDIKDIKIQFVKYKITKFNLIIPGRSEPYEVDPSFVGNFTIEKDYENYVFPYLEFRVVIPDKIYSEVLDNSEDVYVDLKIEYGHFEDVTEMKPEEALYMMGTILEDRFYAFIDNNSPKLTDALAGETNKDALSEGEDDLSQYSFDNNKALVMALYRADHIFNTNKIINKILAEATCADAVCYYMMQIEASKVLMSPSDNAEQFDQLALPPLPANQGLMYTVNTYALHKAGTIVFFDYDMIYILNKKLGCTAWQNNEYKTTYLISYPNAAGNDVMKSGFYSNSKEKYSLINVIGNSISVVNESMFDDQIIGGNVVAIDSNTGEVTELKSSLKVSEKSQSKKDAINRVVVMNTGSDGTEREKATLVQAQKVMNLVMENINIRALAPNKDFVFSTDNDKYSDLCGHYRITNMTATFTKESEMYGVQCTGRFVGGTEE